MSGFEASALHTEWSTLQGQFHSFEKTAVHLKLAGLIALGVLVFHRHFDYLIVFITAALWVTEGMIKTYQARISDRLLVVEKAIAEQQHYKAMQLNTMWSEQRAGGVTLIISYMRQCLKPTVAFPHIFVVLLALVATSIPLPTLSL
ncbi:hypothetical protein OE749_13540 [Aestuariibacter sp. AA17]|uniref:ABC transmembrane type-1 domain-containing protein n=1 Tax=Fluctibacter corallii TaxID=2984329 RepID=A0ABT3AAL2_9ALTE|nr:hypothetical protein [Aestuariibacter sp. AA17]MCV2885716.1 hypothetical protein [Aestuariibacter sp. AA17]